MRRAVRVLKVAACPFPYPRGTPIRIYNLAAGLAERGHDVHVATYHLGADAVDASFRIHRTRKLRSYRRTSPGPTYRKLLVLDPLLFLEVRRLLRRERFDVIHAHHFEGLMVAAAARPRSGPPIVFDSHTLLESELHHYALGLPRGAKRTIGRYLDLRLPGRADHVIAVTDDMRRRMIEDAGLSAESVSVIPNGVEVEPFDRVGAAPRPERAAGEPKRVVFTGNLARYQGIDLLLEAFRILRESHGNVVLDVVTEDAWEPYARRAAEAGVEPYVQVHRVGFESVPGLLAAGDVAVNPRVDCDGLPQKLLNYMAAGKPVVSFEGSAKQLVDHVHGLIVPNGDTEAFARATHRLLVDEELSRSLGAAGRAFVRTELSWETTAARVEAVYERLL